MVSPILRSVLWVSLFMTTMPSAHAYPSDAFIRQAKKKCPHFVFYGQTQNRQKEVLICLESNQVRYQFGKIGAKERELDFTLPKTKTEYAYQSASEYTIGRFALFRGQYTYEISTITSVKPNAEDVTSAVLNVTLPKGKLVQINLHDDKVISEINYNLEDKNIPESSAL